jgi:hypothetical protein
MSKQSTPPEPVDHFPHTFRLQCYNRAVELQAQAVRDNHIMWLIHKHGQLYFHRFLCFCKSYDTIWRMAVEHMSAPSFSILDLPYRVGKNGPDDPVTIYHPMTGKTQTIAIEDTRSRKRAPRGSKLTATA